MQTYLHIVQISLRITQIKKPPCNWWLWCFSVWNSYCFLLRLLVKYATITAATLPVIISEAAVSKPRNRAYVPTPKTRALVKNANIWPSMVLYLNVHVILSSFFWRLFISLSASSIHLMVHPGASFSSCSNVSGSGIIPSKLVPSILWSGFTTSFFLLWLLLLAKAKCFFTDIIELLTVIGVYSL